MNILTFCGLVALLANPQPVVRDSHTNTDYYPVVPWVSDNHPIAQVILPDGSVTTIGSDATHLIKYYKDKKAQIFFFSADNISKYIK